MRLRPRAFREEPEINFIPLIDVLLVILIFLMVTTTYSRYASCRSTCRPPKPIASRSGSTRIDVGVDAQGNYSVNKKAIAQSGAAPLSQELQRSARP